MPLNHLLNDITTDQLYFIVIALVLLVLTVFFVKLVQGILQTLARLNSTAESVNNLLREIRPAAEGLEELEETLKKTLVDTSCHIERLQNDVSRLMEAAAQTISSYENLEKSLQARIEDEVPPILEETKEMVTGAREITSDIQEKIRATDNLFEAVNEAGQTVRMATGIVKGGITGLAVQLASMAVGARTSLEHITRNISKDNHTKGGDSNE